MSKAKICIPVLVCAAGLLLVSCNAPKYRLRVAMDESGYYAVDVARYSVVKAPGSDPEYVASFDDAVAEVRVSYLSSIDELPTYPATHSIHLTSYKVKWRLEQGYVGVLMPRTGGLDQVVSADPTGKSEVTIPILVVPAGFKESSEVLVELWAPDPPSAPPTFNGQMLAKGTIEVYGTDMTTGEENISASVDFTAAFADYMEPNKAH